MAFSVGSALATTLVSSVEITLTAWLQILDCDERIGRAAQPSFLVSPSSASEIQNELEPVGMRDEVKREFSLTAEGQPKLSIHEYLSRSRNLPGRVWGQPTNEIRLCAHYRR